jgi:molybdenum cofactor cytidylyltransferase
MQPRIGGIILAAGESSRFGRPKQLALFEGKTLIERAVESATAVSGCIVVVLGAQAEQIRPAIPSGARIVINDQWPTGMASSIRAGVRAIASEVDAALLMVCDQPLITAANLRRMTEQFLGGIVAAEYNQTVGVPALFGAEFFPRLSQLSGAEGAKKVILENEKRVTAIPMPEAAFDIDTAEDFRRLGRLDSESPNRNESAIVTPK